MIPWKKGIIRFKVDEKFLVLHAVRTSMKIYHDRIVRIWRKVVGEDVQM